MNRVINWGQVALVAAATIYTGYHGISAIALLNEGHNFVPSFPDTDSDCSR
jgi:hypothetical protein